MAWLPNMNQLISAAAKKVFHKCDLVIDDAVFRLHYQVTKMNCAYFGVKVINLDVRIHLLCKLPDLVDETDRYAYMLHQGAPRTIHQRVL